MVIAVDFDDTCVMDMFPKIGYDIGAAPVLRKLVDNGNFIILNTIRSNRGNDKFLDQAVDWFKKNNIPLIGINKHPTQHTWTDSTKIHASLYIDNLGLGVPLLPYCKKNKTTRGFVDWIGVIELLKTMDLLSYSDIATLVPKIQKETSMIGNFNDCAKNAKCLNKN